MKSIIEKILAKNPKLNRNSVLAILCPDDFGYDNYAGGDRCTGDCEGCFNYPAKLAKVKRGKAPKGAFGKKT